MKELNKEELILSLIQDNLINLKLVYGLDDLGLVPDDYYLNLGDTVFKLMGFEASAQNDFIFENVFMANTRKVRSLNFSNSKEDLKDLSESIYKDLIFAKEICDKNVSDRS